MKTDDFQTTKLWKQTLRKLKLVAVLTDSSMVEVAERLVSEELDRIGYHESAQDQTESNA